MTHPPEPLPVKQADREAAAAMWRLCGNPDLNWQADWMADGTADSGPVVQAFARHRLATLPPSSADVKERARELLAATVGGCSAATIRHGNSDQSATITIASALRALERALQPSNEAMLREALEELQKAEATYRYAHDVFGGGDLKTGRAWDLMRRAGDKARSALQHPSTLALQSGEVREACNFPPGERFSFHDEPGEHDPCYVVMPGGASLELNHDAGEGVDIARAKFIIAACNAALDGAVR